MKLFELLVTLHVAGVLLTLGAAAVGTAVGIMAGRTGRPRSLVRLLDLQHRAVWFVTVPGALLAIVLGAWLVSDAGHPHGAVWLAGAAAVWLLAMALDVRGLLPHNRRLRAEAAVLAGLHVEESAQLRAAARAPNGIAVGVMLDVGFLLLLYAAVFGSGG